MPTKLPISTDFVAKAGDQIASAIKQAQDLTVATVGTATAAVGNLIPAIPFPAAIQGRLPAPVKVVKDGFGLAERVLTAQRDYAMGMVEAFEPLTTKLIPNGAPTAKTKASPKA